MKSHVCTSVVHANDSGNKIFKSKYSSAKRNICFHEQPTPLDFDSFIPWFCLELQVSKNVVVTRTNQVEYVRHDSKLSKGSSSKTARSKSRSTKTKLISIKSDIGDKKISNEQKISFATSTVDIVDAIPVTACYDKRGRLVEIAIVGCPFPIPRKVIQAFNLCLPFHSGLSKLSIRKGGLCQTILYEIGKLLPHSNITEICLDDSRVPGGSYSILLDRVSHLRYLSLKRCDINDVECKKIAQSIDLKGPAIKSLVLLDLTSNKIMDEGAQALGETLKNNRHLLYLNLSENNISDAGVYFILQYLQEFPLTFDDIKQKRARRFEYLKSRSITYLKCLEETRISRLESKTKKDLISDVLKQSKRRKIKKHVVHSFNIEETTVEDDAEKKTNEIIGEYRDPFEEEYIKRKDNCVYSVGNFTLTYLNLAYNNLTLLSARKILKILKYQCEMNKETFGSGLLRVVIDGNNIPAQCNEVNEIDLHIKRAVSLCDESFSLSFNSHPYHLM